MELQSSNMSLWTQVAVFGSLPRLSRLPAASLHCLFTIENFKLSARISSIILLALVGWCFMDFPWWKFCWSYNLTLFRYINSVRLRYPGNVVPSIFKTQQPQWLHQAWGTELANRPTAPLPPQGGDAEATSESKSMTLFCFTATKFYMFYRLETVVRLRCTRRGKVPLGYCTLTIACHGLPWELQCVMC